MVNSVIETMPGATNGASEKSDQQTAGADFMSMLLSAASICLGASTQSTVKASPVVEGQVSQSANDPGSAAAGKPGQDAASTDVRPAVANQGSAETTQAQGELSSGGSSLTGAARAQPKQQAAVSTAQDSAGIQAGNSDKAAATVKGSDGD